MFDLRSDTVTKPTDAMRRAMMQAEVGDDVYGEDPSVLKLERRTAEILGKEAALFVTSGTMANQLAIATQTRPGDEVIVGEGAHPVWYESGAASALSGVQFEVAGKGGFFDEGDIDAALKPVAYYCPRTSLLSLENTHNRGGGKVLPSAKAKSLANHARSLGLKTHLDGARLWNAAAATGEPEEAFASAFDTVSVCFSKGLGAPVGSALGGTRALVEEARRFRKMWGGGMRQAGILAAAAFYALEHHRARLKEDHEAARALAQALERSPGVKVSPPETNIVNIDVPCAAEHVVALAKARGLLVNASGKNRLRAVTHLDVPGSAIAECAKILIESIHAASNIR